LINSFLTCEEFPPPAAAAAAQSPPPQTYIHTQQDFTLTVLGGPTEQEVLEQRAAEYAAAEATRRALLAKAEVALWEQVQMQAAEVASEARVAFK
jgi:hypothetical protein